MSLEQSEDRSFRLGPGAEPGFNRVDMFDRSASGGHGLAVRRQALRRSDVFDRFRTAGIDHESDQVS